MMKHFGDDAESEAPKLLLLLSRAGSIRRRTTGRMFECKTCNRTFPTFQALGGHMTGHKRQLEEDAPSSQTAATPKKAAHECPVCGLIFPMGQALGGHMRRHKVGIIAGSRNNNNTNSNSSNCDKEEDATAAANSTGASDLLSGCSSDARHWDGVDDDDLKGRIGIGFSPRRDVSRVVDLELRLGLARPTLVGGYDEGCLTTLRLGVES